MTGFLGADVEAMVRLSNRLRATADDLRLRGRSVTGLVAATAWQGPDAAAFNERWKSTHAPSLEGAASLLEDLSTQLKAQADQQRVASDDPGASAVQPGGGASGSTAQGLPPQRASEPSDRATQAGSGPGGGQPQTAADASFGSAARTAAPAAVAAAAMPFAFLPGLPGLPWPWQPVAESPGMGSGGGGSGSAGMGASAGSGEVAAGGAAGFAGVGFSAAAPGTGSGQATTVSSGVPVPGAEPGAQVPASVVPGAGEQASAWQGPVAPSGADPGAPALSAPAPPEPAVGNGGQAFGPASVVKALRDVAPDPRFIAGSFLGAGALTAAQVVRAGRDKPGDYLDAGMEQRTGLLGFLSRATGTGGRHHSVTVGLGGPTGSAPIPTPGPSQAWNAIGAPRVR